MCLGPTSSYIQILKITHGMPLCTTALHNHHCPSMPNGAEPGAWGLPPQGEHQPIPFIVGLMPAISWAPHIMRSLYSFCFYRNEAQIRGLERCQCTHTICPFVRTHILASRTLIDANTPPPRPPIHPLGVSVSPKFIERTLLQPHRGAFRQHKAPILFGGKGGGGMLPNNTCGVRGNYASHSHRGCAMWLNPAQPLAPARMQARGLETPAYPLRYQGHTRGRCTAVQCPWSTQTPRPKKWLQRLWHRPDLPYC